MGSCSTEECKGKTKPNDSLCTKCQTQTLRLTNRHRFHEVMVLRALMRAVPSLRENGNEMLYFFQYT